MINYNEIDPGIRDLVKQLNDLGYITTDSGDGTNYKAGMECAIPERHVFGTVPEGEDIREFGNKLHELLPEAHIEISFNPEQGDVVWMVFPDGLIPMW